MVDQVISCCDSLTMALAPEAGFDVLLTDPPYSDHVHSNATSQSKGRGTRHRDLGFDSISQQIRLALAGWANKANRWSIIFSDVEGSHELIKAARETSVDVEYVRTLAWVRWSMPQLSGDRPPQGFEHVLLFHPRGKKRWNGPGNITHLSHLALRGEGKHRCEKPLDQALDLVSWFTDPCEKVFDPFAGSGTFGLACRLLGRSYVGFELDPAWAEKAANRLVSPLTRRDAIRVHRWIESVSEPVSAPTDGPSVIRAQRRRLDKLHVVEGLAQ